VGGWVGGWMRGWVGCWHAFGLGWLGPAALLVAPLLPWVLSAHLLWTSVATSLSPPKSAGPHPLLTPSPHPFSLPPL
jgi:hypothetical protein